MINGAAFVVVLINRIACQYAPRTNRITFCKGNSLLSVVRNFPVIDVVVIVCALMRIRWLLRGALLAARAIENRHCRRLQEQTGEPERAAPTATTHRLRLDTTCTRNRPRQQRHVNHDARECDLLCAVLIGGQSVFQLGNRRQFKILKLKKKQIVTHQSIRIYHIRPQNSP